jgi:hypothetical protein
MDMIGSLRDGRSSVRRCVPCGKDRGTGARSSRSPGSFVAIVACAIAFGAVPAPAPLSAQAADTLPAVAAYHVVAFHYATQPARDETEIFFSLGRAFVPRADGPWLLHVDGGAGVSLYGSIQDIGYLVGIRPSAAYLFRGDYLDVGVPIEFYATVGGAAYLGWNLPGTDAARAVVPMVAVGGGLRFRGIERFGMLELLWERPVAVWTSRLSWRLGIHWPRHGR